jgi:hypothetical protein
MILLQSLTLLLALSLGVVAMDNPFESNETETKQTEKLQDQRRHVNSHRPQPVLNKSENIQTILDKALKKREEAIFKRQKTLQNQKD